MATRSSVLLLVLTLLVLTLVSPASPAWAQKRAVDSLNRGHRMILVDQLVTDAVTHRTKPAHVDGFAFVVLAFHPDKKHVLVELVGASYESLSGIRAEIA